jgi:hypothetical protein
MPGTPYPRTDYHHNESKMLASLMPYLLGLHHLVLALHLHALSSMEWASKPCQQMPQPDLPASEQQPDSFVELISFSLRANFYLPYYLLLCYLFARFAVLPVAHPGEIFAQSFFVLSSSRFPCPTQSER